MKWLYIISVLTLFTGVQFLNLNALAQRFSPEQLQKAQQVPEVIDVKSITLRDGSVREYSIHLPNPNPNSKLKLPLLLVFHGGGGPFTSRQKVTNMKNSTRFDQIADKGQFIVVYPMAYGPHWNDNRPEMPDNSDLEFISTLISDLEKTANVDPRKVYATGISNGAFFVNFLGLRLADKISALASVCGPIPTVDSSLRPTRPVSALLIDGTNDPKVPFFGGGINGGVSGQTLSHDDSVGYWISVNGGVSQVISQTTMPSPFGGNSRISVWRTRNGALVGSVVILGGLHQWYNTKNANFDASTFIWRFFKSQDEQKSN